MTTPYHVPNGRPETAAKSGPAPEILSSAEVEIITGLSKTTLWRLVKRNDFPSPVRLSPGRTGYSARAVAKWIAERTGVAPDSAL
jgi:prophage regulatory protein